MNDLNKNKPHFILPEVYGDSLSYYEVLKQLIKNLEDLTKIVNDKFDENSKVIVNNYLMELFSDILYDEKTENINFYFNLLSNGNIHEYNANNEKMSIK